MTPEERQHLTAMLDSLLKWRYQPTHRTPSWRRSIWQARDAIADRVAGSPSLRDYPAQCVPLTYRRARRDAADETGLPLATFPEACPLDAGPGAGRGLLAGGWRRRREQ